MSKTAIIYVFSGTGNTLTAAEMIQDALSDHDIKAEIYSVSKTDAGVFPDIPDPNDYDINIFGYPIHSYNTPKFFQNFVKLLPELSDENMGRKAYIFKTSGEPFAVNNSSSHTLVSILRTKGMKSAQDMHMLMPYNIIKRYPDGMVKQMFIHTIRMSEIFAYKIARDMIDEIKFNPFVTFFSFIAKIQQPGARINSRLYKADMELCDGCLECVNNCPSRNIIMINGKLEFGKDCIMCMICTMRCPHNAVKPGLITPLRVNGMYDFESIMSDNSIKANYTGLKKAGYFKRFRKYYKRTNAEYKKLFANR